MPGSGLEPRPAPAGCPCSTGGTHLGPADAQLIDAQNAGDASPWRRRCSRARTPICWPTVVLPCSCLRPSWAAGACGTVAPGRGAGGFSTDAKDSERGRHRLAAWPSMGPPWRGATAGAGGASCRPATAGTGAPMRMARKAAVALPGVAARQGQSLVEPAPASRGETPAMLAAAKGRLAAILEWLQAQGVVVEPRRVTAKRRWTGPSLANRQMPCAGCKSASQWRLEVQV